MGLNGSPAAAVRGALDAADGPAEPARLGARRISLQEGVAALSAPPESSELMRMGRTGLSA